MNNFDTVVLTRDLPDHGLKRGDLGAVVELHGDGSAEVEFVDAEGLTVALVGLASEDFREMEGREILHARPLGA